MSPRVGDVFQPPLRDFVQVFQRAERAAVEQVLFHVVERPFHFPLRLTPPRPAGPRPVTVVRGECQEPRVVHRLVAVVAGHHDLHVVVQARGGHTAQVRKRPHVLADRGREILRLDEPQILPPRVSQHVTEQMHATRPLPRKRQRVRRIVHLRLLARGRLESLYPFGTGDRTQFPQAPFDRVVTATESQLLQLFVRPHRRDIRIAFQQLRQQQLVLVQRTGPTPLGTRQLIRRRALAAPSLMRGQDLLDLMPRDPQLLRDPPP